MKKVFYPLACCLAAGVLVSCSGQKKAGSAQEEQSANEVALSYSKSLKAAEMDSLQLPVDADELDTENLLCDCDYTGIF